MSFNTSNPFALVCKDDTVTFYSGEIHQLRSLHELKKMTETHVSEILFMNPFRTIRERGYEAHGDEPILVLAVEEKITHTKHSVLDLLASLPNPNVDEFIPTQSDETYIRKVEEIQKNEIGAGNICQMIFSRILLANLTSDMTLGALATYRNLLVQKGQYMTFLFSDGRENIFVSATPEQHLSVDGDTIMMNPIAGTLPKGDMETLRDRLAEFLSDPKEINELAQVLDEELKMMERICETGGKIIGPFLRQNGAVIHTEYKILGKKKRDLHAIDALRETLHAPTLVGGPIQSASERIAKYESESRGYYGGEFGIYENGDLDTAISIRMAHFMPGVVRIQSGGGIVRDSLPENELRESKMKALGIQKAIQGSLIESTDVSEFLQDESLQQLLQSRNDHLAKFYFEEHDIQKHVEVLKGKNGVIIDHEDNFSLMIARMMRSMGMNVRVIPSDDFSYFLEKPDIVILGPGPGDILDEHDEKMQNLKKHIARIQSHDIKTLGICLGHQAINHHMLGKSINRLFIPLQGVQKSLDLHQKDGSIRTAKLGFYNSFIPYEGDKPIFTVNGKNIAGFQFHPESIMSEDGYDILANQLTDMFSE